MFSINKLIFLDVSSTRVFTAPLHEEELPRMPLPFVSFNAEYHVSGVEHTCRGNTRYSIDKHKALPYKFRIYQPPRYYSQPTTYRREDTKNIIAYRYSCFLPREMRRLIASFITYEEIENIYRSCTYNFKQLDLYMYCLGYNREFHHFKHYYFVLYQ